MKVTLDKMVCQMHMYIYIVLTDRKFRLVKEITLQQLLWTQLKFSFVL